MAKETKIVQKITPRRTAGSTQPVDKPATGLVLNEERIRQRAYEIYMRRNGGPGDPKSDWAQAERELRAEISRK